MAPLSTGACFLSGTACSRGRCWAACSPKHMLPFALFPALKQKEWEKGANELWAVVLWHTVVLWPLGRLSGWRAMSGRCHMALVQDKGGRRVALRPELTPTLARLALQRGKGLPLPAKWSQVPPPPSSRRLRLPWSATLRAVSGVRGRGFTRCPQMLALFVQIGQCWRYERATRGRRRVHW